MCMAERIKKRRIEMGYTQEELAAKLGLQKSAIEKYENGRVKNIKRSVISKMAEILDCPPSYLMGWSDNSHSCEKNTGFDKDQDSIYILKDASSEHSEHERELLKIFTALNEGNRKKVITFSKNLYSI